MTADPWQSEPDPHPEARHTPWAEGWWTAWNPASPEVQWAAAVAMVAARLQPSLVVETGVGQGYVTRRLAACTKPSVRLICYDNDPAWLPDGGYAHVEFRHGCPPDSLLAEADLVALDSDSTVRTDEIGRAARLIPAESVMVVHDCTDRHGPSSSHWRYRAACAATGLPGVWTGNPRGGWAGSRLRDLHHLLDDLLPIVGTTG